MKNEKEVVLEPSTNTHVLKANKISKEIIDESTLLLKIEGEGVVSHGEHGTIKTESKNVMKYVQQELNPVTKKMQNAFD